MNKNNMGDPVQLQQKIIYFKAELAKYKEKVKDYQENYHYAQLDNLKEQNIKLLEDKAELDYQVEKMEKELQTAEEIIAEQQSDRSRMHIKNKSLQELLQKQESEFRVMKENLIAKNEHIMKEKEKIQNKAIELEQSNRELQEKYQKIVKQLENNMNVKQKEEGALEEKCKELAGTIDQLKEQISVHEQTETQLKSKLEEYHSKKEASSTESLDWKKWKQAKEETIESLTQDNLILKSQVDKLKQKLESNK
ncbi:hypothetical protein SAMN05421743_103184 [Thalassobacillus cyri]|uniref:Uncharacterized protein n=1 Tax=Thalassobacillus cyri TaxID=571932 RepID=A0A1H3ZB06_9BACI|nr:hypothetical protein [Thalassobacillus cyri]SEA20857.1 hypothetical protein SAMN05421743_103184 [Thalassobacillus cyri]